MKKRVLYFDVLNIVATFGVVAIHCNGIAHVFSNTAEWYQALVYEVIFYCTVPIFFMLSGATLMGYRERYSTKDFFVRRLLRTAIPFVIWTCISAAFLEIYPWKIGWRTFFNRAFGNTSIENVYWFFIPLFAIYLAMPVISLLKEHRQVLWYMAGGTFALSGVFPFVFGYLGLSWNYSLQMVNVGGYLLFVILGYLFATEEWKRWQRMIIYGLGVAGAALRYGMTVLLSIRDGQINKSFWGFTQYHVIFLTVAIFTFFRYSRVIEKLSVHPKVVSVLKALSGCSFGVYLMHMILYRQLAEVWDTTTWKWRILVPFVIYGIAVGITFVLKKIPGIKHIVP